MLSRAARGGASHWFAGHYHRNAGGTFHLATHGVDCDDDDDNDDDDDCDNNNADDGRSFLNRKDDKENESGKGVKGSRGGGSGGGGGGGSGGSGYYSDTVEVVTTAALGGNLTTNEAGDALGLTGIRGVAASDRLSGLRIVTVRGEATTADDAAATSTAGAGSCSGSGIGAGAGAGYNRGGGDTRLTHEFVPLSAFCRRGSARGDEEEDGKEGRKEVSRGSGRGSAVAPSSSSVLHQRRRPA